jgi:DNA-binding transcriptional regulator YhcF (GntR family)
VALLDEFVLDRDAEVPLGVQLAWALRARIGDGRFAPGQRLPGLRDLAEALHINANTVRAVYQRLEHEGVLVSRQGSGTFVADAPLQTPSAVDTIAANAAREARDTGVDPRAVAAAFYVAPADAGHPADAEASRRRELRSQIAALQRTLGELEARHPALVPRFAQPGVAAGPRLLDVRELEQVQAQLVARLATLHDAIDKLAHKQTPAVKSRVNASVSVSSKTRANTKTKTNAKANARTNIKANANAKAKPKTRPAHAGA